MEPRKNANFIDQRQKMAKAQAEATDHIRKVAESFVLVMDTKPGVEVIKFLVAQSKVFADSLSENQKLKTLNAPEGYLAAQQDFGKMILSFLTETQVAKLFIETKGGANGKDSIAGSI